jgi:hypothetical protein
MFGRAGSSAATTLTVIAERAKPKVSKQILMAAGTLAKIVQAIGKTAAIARLPLAGCHLLPPADPDGKTDERPFPFFSGRSGPVCSATSSTCWAAVGTNLSSALSLPARKRVCYNILQFDNSG